MNNAVDLYEGMKILAGGTDFNTLSLVPEHDIIYVHVKEKDQKKQFTNEQSAKLEELGWHWSDVDCWAMTC